MHVLMSHKRYYLYKNLFIKIKQLLIDFKIEVDFKKISIMTDFERGIRKALKEVFDGKPLYDCYFHFIKNLWEKAKQFGLFKRDLRKTTSIIIFSMKMYPYLIRELITSVNGFIKN